MQTIKASIIGVSGYTGLELLRLLLLHPRVEIAHLSSRQNEDEKIGNIFPHLAHLPYRFSKADALTIAQDSNIVFIALPHRAAQDVVAQIHGKTRIVDLSADFRLDDAATYERYYEPHRHPHLLKDVAYGLPEIFGREKIKNAATVANPGCFALLGQIMLFPFKGRIKSADLFAITGSSGAGKTPGDGTHHPVRSHNIKSYSINTHRHLPEITRAAGIAEAQLNFVPTSGPYVRGIFAQAFVTLSSSSDIQECYKNELFIRMQNDVALAHVVGSNFVDINFAKGQDGRILVQGALDNLIKGAAGSAIQNMNIMLGLEEDLGLLNLSPILP
ncbi:MAG: N-acetyl-gamma-glutamyl-phosphate reductase [Alphaproteobacteria bacterium]|nr:N-acetyl-gamma-glutamyl-phosphate reductase [Alphaproteobacteria bacterium]